MTVKCKHGTEVYKFRCPECADAERGRNMTADKFDSADGQTHCESELIATDEEIEEYRKRTEQWMNRENAVEVRILNRLAASEKENALLKGAMAADDERLRNAEKRIYPDVTWGCDAAEHMADLIIGLRSELADLRAKVDEAHLTIEAALEHLGIPDDKVPSNVASAWAELWNYHYGNNATMPTGDAEKGNTDV